MASRHEVFSIELERTTKAIFNPLASTHENSSFQTNIHNVIPGEDEEAFRFWNTGRANDNLGKASCTWKPVEDDSKRERNDIRFYRTAETGAQQSRKPLTTTNLHTRAFFSEKENVESGSTRTRLGLSSSKAKDSSAQHKISAGFLDFTEVKRLQEVSNKPLSQREVNVLDEAGGGLDVSSGSIASEYGVAAAFLEGSESLHLKGEHLNRPLEEFVCSKPDCSQVLIEQPLTVLVQDRLRETSWGSLQSTESLKAPLFSIESLKAPPLSDRNENEILCGRVRPDDSMQNPCEKPRQCSETAKVLVSMKAPLLSEFEDRSENEILCGRVRLDDPVQNPCEKLRRYSKTAKAPEIQCVERSPCELSECSRPYHSQDNQDPQANSDHVVVFFSVQKFLQENAAGVNRHKLSKLSSLCSLYSRKALCWVRRICREQNITNCLRHIQQIFSPSARGFARLDSQKLPEFSTKMSSPSPKRILAKDNELKAVLLKINEVFTSMETTSSDYMQDRNRSGATGFSHG